LLLTQIRFLHRTNPHLPFLMRWGQAKYDDRIDSFNCQCAMINPKGPTRRIKNAHPDSWWMFILRYRLILSQVILRPKNEKSLREEFGELIYFC